MPRGYGFPQANGVWRPLHLRRIPEARPRLSYVFGRLAPGRSRDETRAQVAAIGPRTATMFPETHKNVRLQVVSLPDAVSYWDGGLQFGGVWTVVIVAQIALTTVLPVPLLGVGFGAKKTTAGFAAEEFLTATLAVDRVDVAAASGDTVPAVRAARLETRYRAPSPRGRGRSACASRSARSRCTS